MIRKIYGYSLGLALALVTTASLADGIDQHRLVNGMDIYYGVVPAEVWKAIRKSTPKPTCTAKAVYRVERITLW
jgi:hypothetical protein